MAWLFMQWVTRPENHLKNNTVGKQGSAVLKSVARNPEFVKTYNWPGYIRGTEWGYAHTPPDYRPCIPEWRNIGDELGVAVEEAETGIKSPKDALDWANKRATEILDQAGYYKAGKEYPWKAWPYAGMKVTDEDLKKNWQPFE
jgi:ABC-type glycerol-3-phosphate transport system substrate-binding protein